MEIKITEFMKNENSYEFSNSIANSGNQTIGKETWGNAKNCDYEFVTEENRNEFLDYFLDFGAWEKEEIDSILELNSLFIQYISGDIQQYEYEEENKIPDDSRESNIFKSGTDFYFYLGH